MKLKIFNSQNLVTHEISVPDGTVTINDVRVWGKGYKDRSMAELQRRHMAWVRRNFPAQVTRVTAEDVAAVIQSRSPDDGRSLTQFLADAINAQDSRITRFPHHGLLGAAEEIGELCHAFLKMQQGIRKGGDWRAAAEDAIADCILFLTSFCNTHGFDLEKIVWDTFEREVEPRDWVTYPETGRPPVAQVEAKCDGESTLVEEMENGVRLIVGKKPE